MGKPKILFTRPAYWTRCKSDKLELIHVPLRPDGPVRLRNGKPCFESVGGILTEEGAANLIRLFKEHKPDIFLFFAMYSQDGSKDRMRDLLRTLRKARSVSPNTRFLYGNGNQQGFPDFNVKAYLNAGVLDGILVGTRDPRERKMYNQVGINFVRTLHTFGFDPERHGPRMFGVRRAKYDCMFGGSQTMDMKTGRAVKFYPRNPMLGGKYANSKERLDFIMAVDREFKLLVRGKGRWPLRSVAKYAYGEEYPRTFADARIVLNMYHWDLQQYYTKRTIYSLASSRMLICKYIPGMEKDFKNGRHLVWFREVPEAIEKIRYYLHHDREREEIGKAGREIAIKNHSWEPRLREFEGIVGELLG